MARSSVSSALCGFYRYRACVLYEMGPFLILHVLGVVGLCRGLHMWLRVFACAIRGVPFLPWTKPKFPNILVDISAAADIPTQYTIPMGSSGNVMKVSTRLRSWRVQITNLEPEQNASLTIWLYVKLLPGSRGQVGESIWTPPRWPIDPALGLKQLDMPIIIEPGKSAGGDLVFEIDGIDLARWGDVVQPLQKRFVITDRTSGQQKEIVTEADVGNFDRSKMTPMSHPGLEILGPEHKPKPEGKEQKEPGDESAQRS
jgi:hypothetical protein